MQKVCKEGVIKGMNLTLWIILLLNPSVSSIIYMDTFFLPISLINLRMFLLCPYLNIMMLCNSHWPRQTLKAQANDKG